MIKRFRLDASEIRRIATGHGACMASDHITVEGKQVGCMYRQEPSNRADSAAKIRRRVQFEIPEQTRESWLGRIQLLVVEGSCRLFVFIFHLQVGESSRHDPAVLHCFQAEDG